MKGFWGRGVEVIGEWVKKKRESGGVGVKEKSSLHQMAFKITF